MFHYLRDFINLSSEMSMKSKINVPPSLWFQTPEGEIIHKK